VRTKKPADARLFSTKGLGQGPCEKKSGNVGSVVSDVSEISKARSIGPYTEADEDKAECTPPPLWKSSI